MAQKSDALGILKVQPVSDPRSYKLVNAVQSTGNHRVVQAIYSVDYVDDFFRTYMGDATIIGRQLPASLPYSRNLNWALMQAYQMTWPMNRLLAKRIENLSTSIGARIIHTNGAPDVFGYLCKKLCRLPVVHEIYDTYSLYDSPAKSMLRSGMSANPLHAAFERTYRSKNLAWEEFVHRHCDALVFTSDEMRKSSEDAYGSFTSVVVPNGTCKKDLPMVRREKLSTRDGRIHCVYLGAVNSSLSHRMILPQIMEVASNPEVTLHIYPTTGTSHRVDSVSQMLTGKPNIVVHRPLHYSQLYEEITQYDLGLVLLNKGDEALLHTALPNKIFEYASAGLTVAVPPYRSLVNFISTYKCGFAVTDWKEDISGNANLIKDVQFRDEFTIDYYIPNLMRLYERLMA